ncbi:MAG: penicillin-binding protein 2 [Nitrospirae bacterium]|nr:penicillin-binding protein 2 [Nitrospirota bacterium]
MSTRFITSGKEERDIRRRLKIFVIACSALFAFMLVRLWTLQVFSGAKYRIQSERNRIRLVEVKALRGEIVDRAGRTLAENRAAFDLLVVKEDASKTLARSLGSISRILGVPREDLESRIGSAPAAPFGEIPVARDLSWEQVVTIEAKGAELPGFLIRHVFVRQYPYSSLGAHVLGHLGEITEQEVRQERYKVKYRPGDLVGKLGVERSQEEYLKGVDGGELVEVDAYGSRQTVLDRIPSNPGAKVYLTLDLDLQKVAEAVMEGKDGAVVAMDPRNGEILALVSHPAFDPNAFSRGVGSEAWSLLVNAPAKPLQNRAIAGGYSPGSTFKLVTALAALEQGRLDPDHTVRCRGEYHFGDRAYRCWREHGHGSVALHRAIVESCDIFFYLAGLTAGIDAISDTAMKLGLGRKTGINLLGEQPGLIPTRAWKQKVYKQKWMDGETLSVSIGQSFVTVTPLQLATAYSTFANGGSVFRPRVVSRVIGPEGQFYQDYPVQKEGAISFTPAAYKEVLEGLEGVVSEPTGTGWRVKMKDITIAGKTGTAQVVKMKERTEDKDFEKIPYEYRDHAWFVCFLPAEQPQLAIAVLVEHGGHGASAAAPVARAMIERYLAIRNLPSL